MSLQGVDPQVAIDGRILDPWTVTVPVTIRLGRESPNSQADANTCTFGLIGQLPVEARMNAPVEVFLAWGQGGIWSDIWEKYWSTDIVTGDPDERLTRFVGRVTDLNPVSESGGLHTELVATGRLGDLGRVKSGWYVYPEETEEARVDRLAIEAADAGVDLGGRGYSWHMAKREIGTASLLDILYDTATAGGVVHETIEGAVQFDNWSARSAAQPVLYLSPSDLEDSVGWSQQIDAFIQRAVIRYGTPAEGNSEQPQVIVGKRAWGRPETVISTFLRDPADATQFGNLVLSRWGDQGAFEAPVLNVLASLVPADTWDALTSLTVGDVIVTTGVTSTPAPLPQGGGEWFVEGWSEVFDKTGSRLAHRVALAVSDRQRFRPDLGDPVTIGDVAVTPQDAMFGVARTVTARLSTVYGQAVDRGPVRLLEGNREIGYLKTPTTTGAVTFALGGNQLTVGSHVLTLAYSGAWPDYLAAAVDTRPVTVGDPSKPGDPPLSSISVTVSTHAVNEGQKVTHYALVGMTRGASRAGRVYFQVSRDVGKTFTEYARVTTGAHAAEVSAQWPAVDGTRPVRLRARFDPDLAGAATVGGAQDVDVLAKAEKTLGYPCTWDATYNGNGNLDTTAKPIWQGYAEPSKGNQKGLAGFAIPPADWAGWTVTKVELWLHSGTWKGSSGNMRIGSHPHISAPPSAPSIYAGRTVVTGWKEDQGKWVNITSWGKGLATTVLKGIVLGPGRDPSNIWRGWAYGYGNDGPVVRITGYRWE